MLIFVILSLIGAYSLLTIVQRYISVFHGPLSKFPGPLIAAATSKYKFYIEVVQQISWVDKLAELHKQYGPAVRVGLNELHFSTPEAYNDIYNNKNRWDKERSLYTSFGEDESSFGFLSYPEARERKAVMQPLFSRNAVSNLQGVIQGKLDELCKVLSAYGKRGESANIFFATRCFTMDVITSYCFSRSVDAIHSPSFRAPIIEAMEASLPAFIVFKHIPPIRKFVFGLPPWLSKRLSPDTAGLVDMQTLLGAQVNEVTRDPSALEKAPHPIVYHALLKPKDGGEVPSAKSLYEEAQALMFGGGDTTGNTLFLGTLHVLENPEWTKRLKDEIKGVWPQLGKTPKWEDLEKLPFLTAVIKESLRVSPGVPSPLLRMIPPGGVMIDDKEVPGKTIVGMSATFIHMNASLFKDPLTFTPERWLGKNPAPQEWLCSFSKGPRSCLGVNLAWCELYLTFANLFRRYDMKPDGAKTSSLKWRECFLPKYNTDRLNVYFKPVEI